MKYFSALINDCLNISLQFFLQSVEALLLDKLDKDGSKKYRYELNMIIFTHVNSVKLY